MIIIALPNENAGFSKATLVRHRTRRSDRQGKLTTSIDGSDPSGYALVRSGQRARHYFERPFGVIGLAGDTLDREASEHARHSDHIATNKASGITALPRSVLLTNSWRHDMTRPQRQLSRLRRVSSTPHGSSSTSCRALCGRITIAAFQRGAAVADVLRDLLAREFPDTEGDQP